MSVLTARALARSNRHETTSAALYMVGGVGLIFTALAIAGGVL